MARSVVRPKTGVTICNENGGKVNRGKSLELKFESSRWKDAIPAVYREA